MKKTMIIIGVVLVYVFGISYALKYLPLHDAPEWLLSLFQRKSQGSLLWLKIRHLFVVALIGVSLAGFLLRYDRKNVQINSILVGLLSILWGVVFSWAVIRTVYLGWIEVTDYLVVGLWIPVVTAFLSRSSSSQVKLSNQPLEPSR